jgi:hypothetical protein
MRRRPARAPAPLRVYSARRLPRAPAQHSRWFQRFAVYSHRMTKEVTEKSEPWGLRVEWDGARSRQGANVAAWRAAAPLPPHASFTGSSAPCKPQWQLPAFQGQRAPGVPEAAARGAKPQHPSSFALLRAPPLPPLPSGKEGSKVLDEHLGTFAAKAKETASQVGGRRAAAPAPAAPAPAAPVHERVRALRRSAPSGGRPAALCSTGWAHFAGTAGGRPRPC